MYAQLVLFAGLRVKAVKAGVAAVFEKLDNSVGIGFAVGFLRQKKSFTAHQAGADSVGIAQVRARRSEGFVGFTDGFVLEHGLIMTTDCGVVRQQHHARRVFVQTVYRRDVADV